MKTKIKNILYYIACMLLITSCSNIWVNKETGQTYIASPDDRELLSKGYVYKKLYIRSNNKPIYEKKGKKTYSHFRACDGSRVDWAWDTLKTLERVKKMVQAEFGAQGLLTEYENIRDVGKKYYSFDKEFRDYKKFNNIFLNCHYCGYYYQSSPECDPYCRLIDQLTNVQIDTIQPVKLKYTLPGNLPLWYNLYTVETGGSEHLIAVYFPFVDCSGSGFQIDMLIFSKQALSFYEYKSRLYSTFIHNMPAKDKKKKDVKIIDGDTLYAYYPLVEQNYYPFKGDPAYLIPYIYIMSWSEYQPEDVFFEKRKGYQFYYTFYSNKHKMNYRLQYNARTGEFVKYKMMVDASNAEDFIRNKYGNTGTLFFDKQKGKYLYYIYYGGGIPGVKRSICCRWQQIVFNVKTDIFAYRFLDEEEISKCQRKYNLE
jgi:hypothetical protein